MVPPAVVTLWVPGILDVGESFIAFWLLMLSGFVETVVDAAVGSLGATREVFLAAAVVVCLAEVDTTLVTHVLGMDTVVSTVGITLDVGAVLCLTVVKSEF